jgi:phospholipid/cholesterol/gamma-HCH transport system substrate-binding protein
MAKSRKSSEQVERSKLRIGLVLIVLTALAFFLAFTRYNPLAHPYTVTAYFKTSNNLRPASPVRIAGIDVGKVKSVEAANSSGGAKVKLEIQKNGLPLHKDATAKIRPRIFLEGNFFVDLQPGSPSAPQIKSGGSIPMTQTATPVQLGDVLAALETDTRDDLKTLLREYGGALHNGGAQGINESVPYWKPAYRDSSIVNEAFLGSEPQQDIHNVLRGQAQVAQALTADEGALKGLVTNFNTVAAALASQNVALEQTVPALRDTLRDSRPALKSLDDVLPTLRLFAREALPGVRSSRPALAAAIPFIRQLRLLTSPNELQGAARSLSTYTPSTVRLTQSTIPILTQLRALSACTSNVLVPFINTPIPDPSFPANTNQTVNEQLQRGFVGLAGESRITDANGSFFNTEVAAPPLTVRPAPPPDIGAIPPVHRPDVPCETQDPPNLDAPVASAAAVAGPSESQARIHQLLPHISMSDRRRAAAMLRRVLPQVRETIAAAKGATGASGATGPSGASGGTPR